VDVFTSKILMPTLTTPDLVSRAGARAARHVRYILYNNIIAHGDKKDCELVFNTVPMCGAK
jgi:hypothetical protein